MSLLAFMCTGSNSGWDPLCNGGHLTLLVVLALVLAGVATILLGTGRSAAMVALIGVASTVTSLILTFWVGFALA